MNEKLKKGWTRVAFGDVVRQVHDRVVPEESGLERFVAGEHMNTDDIKIRTWGTVGDGYLGPAFIMRFKPGQVLYGSRRTYLRKVAVADFEGITANTTFVLESKDPKVLLPELLPFIMQTEGFHEHSIKQSKGSVNPYINFSDLMWYEFTLPPLVEQRRIVDVLEEVMSTSEHTQHSISGAEKLRKSAVKEVFEKDMREWPVRAIGDILKVTTGGTPDRGNPRFWHGNIPWVKTAEVNYGVISSTEECITEEGVKGSATKICPPNTVLVALYGQGPTRGRVAVLGVSAASNQACAAILPSALVETQFLFRFLESNYESLRSMAQGAAQPNLNLAMIKGFSMPVPPIEVQRDQVAFIEKIATSKTDLIERLNAIVNIKNKLFEKVFE
jgi:type I restriction enzyme S subunit